MIYKEANGRVKRAIDADANSIAWKQVGVFEQLERMQQADRPK